MKESVVFPGFDVAYNNDNDEFDPEIDFSQFLEEARRFVNEKNQHPKAGEESGTTKHMHVTNQEKKCRKKSWKNAFFSFWRSSSSSRNNKATNNNKQHSKVTSSMGDTIPKRRTAHVSGPIYGVGGAAAASSGRQWDRLAASGPLAGFFHQKKWKDKGVENVLPYVSLDKLNQPPYDAKTYGPIYLVS